MIERLRGDLLEKTPGHIVVAVGGVGYGLDIPLSTFQTLPLEGHAADLHVHTHVRDDAIVLFGFATRDEREAFESLMAVSGVGPALALATLSQMQPAALAGAVESGNSNALTLIKGVGKRTAERIVLELKGKLAKFGWGVGAAAQPGINLGGRSELQDAVAALVGLGMKPAQAEKAIGQASTALGQDAPVEQLVREGLKYRK